MTLRVRERGGLRKVGHTTMASAQNPHSWVPLALKEKLISLNGYPKPYPIVVHTPIVSKWPPSGGVDSKFSYPNRIPAHDRQGIALSGRPLCQTVWSAAADWLSAANLYICMYLDTHTYTNNLLKYIIYYL